MPGCRAGHPGKRTVPGGRGIQRDHRHAPVSESGQSAPERRCCRRETRYRPGFVLTNSEVGAGSLSIRQFVLRLVCRNGAVVEDTYKRAARGQEAGGRQCGRGVPKRHARGRVPKLRLLTMRDHIQATLDEHRFAKTPAQACRARRRVKIEGKAEAGGGSDRAQVRPARG